jgi:peptide-methionine (S)-S-oxide reductase
MFVSSFVAVGQRKVNSIIVISTSTRNSRNQDDPSRLCHSGGDRHRHRLLPSSRKHQQQHEQASRSTTALHAIQEATFGMGCFWEPSESMIKVDGVIDTVVGYTGNPTFDERRRQQQQLSGNNKTKKLNVPSYESVCASREWVEAVRITYEDDIISYPQLLDVMFDQHKSQLGSRQYGSIIFPQSTQQEIDAKLWYENAVSENRTRSSDGWKIEWTSIEPSSSSFYKAEGYHQNYWQKQRPRFVVIGLLLVLSTTGIPGMADNEMLLNNDKIQTIANGLTIAIGLFITLERWFDAEVTELS